MATSPVNQILVSAFEKSVNNPAGTIADVVTSLDNNLGQNFYAGKIDKLSGALRRVIRTGASIVGGAGLGGALDAAANAAASTNVARVNIFDTPTVGVGVLLGGAAGFLLNALIDADGRLAHAAAEQKLVGKLNTRINEVKAAVAASANIPAASTAMIAELG